MSRNDKDNANFNKKGILKLNDEFGIIQDGGFSYNFSRMARPRQIYFIWSNYPGIQNAVVIGYLIRTDGEFTLLFLYIFIGTSVNHFFVFLITSVNL